MATATEDPPRKLSRAEEVALQQAGQYAGSATPITPANAQDIGLDPQRGYVAKGTPTDAPTPPAIPLDPVATTLQQSGAAANVGGPAPLGTDPATSTPPQDDQKPVTDPRIEMVKPAAATQPVTTATQDPRIEMVKPAAQQPPAATPTPASTPDPRIELVQPAPQAQAQPQSQQPTGQVTGAPTGTPDQPWGQPLDPQQQIRALVDAGLSSGAAQAIIAGQAPKTISGNKPAPPTPPKQQSTPAQPPADQSQQPAQPSTPAVKPPVQEAPAPSTTTYIAPPLIHGKAPVGSDLPSTAPAAGSTQATQPAATPDQPVKPDTSGDDNSGAADFFRKRGDTPITSASDPRLTTIQAGGQNWQVNKEAAPSFQGFLNELVSNGAPITLGTGGGWANRGKVGAAGISEHAFGGAIDVNQLPGQRGVITPEFKKWIAANPGALQMAENHWHIYGGEKFGDLGHFEWGGVPMAGQPVKAAPITAEDQQQAAQLDKNLGGLLAGHGGAYVAMGKKYGVDPRLLAAISMEETGNGTSHLLRARNNVGGITGPGHTGGGGDYMPYGSIDEGIEAEASLIRHGYVGQGLDTIEKIGAKWAPPGAFNDPGQSNAEWPAAVRKFYAALGGSGKLGEVSGKYPVFGGSTAKEGASLPGTLPTPGGDTPVAQPVWAIPGGGGGGGQERSPQPQGPSFGSDGGTAARGSSSGSSNVDYIPFPLGGGSSGGGGQPQPQQQQRQAPPDEGGGQAQNPMVQALIQRGFTPQQAAAYAASSQAVAPGKGLRPLQTQGPPPAAPGALPAPSGTTLNLTQAQKQPVQAKLLPAKQLMPSAKIPKLGPPPAAPGAGPDPSVIQGLMKRGFTREQATAFISKGPTVSAGIGQTAKFRPPPAAPAAPSTPQQQAPTRQPQQAAAPPPPAKPPSDQPRQVEPTAFGRPPGSTRGDPTPPGHETINQSSKLTEQAKQHASILSPDDPRVKKQADGYIKGEHFVEGDPFHDSMLNGLPYGKQGRQRELLGHAETAIADSQPMHISYISAPKEAAKFPNRDSRKVQYDEHSPEARLMGTTEGQLVGHSMIPLSAGIKLSSKASEPHQSYIQGISTNVLANNFQHVNDKMDAMGRKTPYKTLGTKFYNDLEGYYHNLNAGHTATGRGYAVGTDDHPNEPDRSHVPYKLSRKEADFIGTVINNTAAFAKHDDAKKIKELARVNGTLITEKGETNRLRHDIEEHEPGWRERVLEPSIRSFKTGLIHEIHPSETHMPESIRPGVEFQNLTKAIARTSERGRPDIPMAASLHHTFEDNRKINQIERDFSKDQINEAEARSRLRALGEDDSEYRFEKGSGGLISPHEDDPEAITAEEHATMKDALRKKWVSGGMGIEDYRKRAAEVPLPTLPTKPSASKEDEPGISPSSPEPAVPRRSGPVRPLSGLSGPGLSGSDLTRSSSTTSSPDPLAKAKQKSQPVEAPPAPPPPKPSTPRPPPSPKPKAPPKLEDTEASEPATPQAVAQPPGPGEPLPAVKTKPAKAKPAKTPAPVEEEPEEKLTKPEGASDKEWMKDPTNEAERQDYLEKRVAASLERQNDHSSAIPLKVQRKDDGGVQHDPGLNPVWEKTDYGIANLPFLQKKKKALSQIEGADKHEDTLDKDEHKHLNKTERKRLSAIREASAVATMGDHVFNSYNKIKDQPDIAAGKGWYSRMRDKMARVFGEGEEGKASEDHELFAQLLGATSAKTPVRDNFIQALDAFEQHKAGKFDRHVKLYKEAHGALQDGGYKALNQKMQSQGILKPGEAAPKTDAASMARWIDHHDIIPKKQNGAKFNSNSEQVLKVLAGKWLGSVKAPKTPNFAGNLTGRTLAATIDVWAARHLHRIGHEFAGEKKGWRPQSAAEPGVNSLDFAFSQDAMKHAADKIGINPDDLQAILWYAEKHHYDQHGWTGAQGAEKGSFDETWDKAFPTEGKAMTSKELQEHYQELAKAA